jgi:murein DD-endopeptidase MepM/ murein hydrolase activator NlpD
VTLAILVLAVAAAAAVPAPRLSLTPRRAPQGSIVSVTVTGPVALAAPVLVDGDRRIPLEPAGPGRLEALLGIDFEAAPGPRHLVVESEGADGPRVVASADLRVVKRTFAVQRLSVDPRFLSPPPEELPRIEREREAFVQAFASSRPGRLWSAPFEKPVAGEFRNNFGARRVFNGKTRSRHGGRDVAAPEGAPVTASAAGRVVLTGDFYFSGGSVVLDHGDGLFTMYFHLSRLDVKEGDAVASGQRIGAVGATGRATGPHLHWAARLSGARIDPAALLSLAPLAGQWAVTAAPPRTPPSR